MWLINVESLALEFFTSSKKVSYAILSHTWEDGEVSFQEFQDLAVASKKKGFDKIRATCSIAKERGQGYAWVDTCCINKESSAELSEAINSMFRWYKNLAVCLVYLSDLPLGTDKELEEQMGTCWWFTRGWTLQELIALALVDFFDREWRLRGSKASLLQPLSRITTIDRDILSGETRLAELLAARKMSWAARRRTTRDEDIAYCLMGIFDINMPLLYGEGYKAFLRLQEEILKQNRDLSVLAWNSQYPETYPYEEAEDTEESAGQIFRGVFAGSPMEFKDCRFIIANPTAVPSVKNASFTVTSKFMRSTFPLVPEGFLYTRGHIGFVQYWCRYRRGRHQESSLRDYAFHLFCIDEDMHQDVRRSLNLVILLRETSLGYLRKKSRKRLYQGEPGPHVMSNIPFLARTHVPASLSGKVVAEYSRALWVPPEAVHHRLELLSIFASPGVLETDNRMLVISRLRGEDLHVYFRFRLRPAAASDNASATENSCSGDNGEDHRQTEFLLYVHSVPVLEMPAQRADEVEGETVGDSRSPPVLYGLSAIHGAKEVYKECLRNLSMGQFDKRGLWPSVGSLTVDRACKARLGGLLSRQGTFTVKAVTVPLSDIGLAAGDSGSDFLYSLRFGWEDETIETTAGH